MATRLVITKTVYLTRCKHPASGLTNPQSLSRDAERHESITSTVRGELCNVIERPIVLCAGSQIGLEHLPGNVLPHAKTELVLGDPVLLNKLEQLHIRSVSAHT